MGQKIGDALFEQRDFIFLPNYHRKGFIWSALTMVNVYFIFLKKLCLHVKGRQGKQIL